MGKELKKTDEAKDLIAENKNQEVKNKTEIGPLKILMDYAGRLLRKHFIDDKNYESALNVTREILKNTPCENKVNVFNMIKNTFAGYETDKNETVESDVKNDAR